MTVETLKLTAMLKIESPLEAAIKAMKGMKAGEALMYAIQVVMPLCMKVKENSMDDYASQLHQQSDALNNLNNILALLNSLKTEIDPYSKKPWSDPDSYKDLVDPYNSGHDNPEEWNPIVKIMRELDPLFRNHAPAFMSPDQLESFENQSGVFGQDWKNYHSDPEDAVEKLGNSLWSAWNMASAQPQKNPGTGKEPATDNGASLKALQDDLNNMVTTVNGMQSTTQAELKVEEETYNSIQSSMKNLMTGFIGNEKPFINGVNQGG